MRLGGKQMPEAKDEERKKRDHIEDLSHHVQGTDQFHSACKCDIAKILGPLEGRSIFTVETETGQAKYVVLRIDPEFGVVSGDLFHDKHDTRWIMSWKSEAIYVPSDAKAVDWEFAAMCDLFLQDKKSSSGMEKVLLTARLTRERTDRGEGSLGVHAFELTLLCREGKIARYSKTDLPSQDRIFPSFRRLELDFKVSESFRKDAIAKEVIRNCIGGENSENLVAQALGRDKLYREEQFRERDFKSLFDPKFSGATTVNELERLALKHVTDFRKGHHFAVFISDLADEPDESKVPLGRALGIDDKVRRPTARRASLVFLNEIIASYKRSLAHGGGPKSYEELEQTDEGKAQIIRDLSGRLAFSIIHELAHQLNLPHNWQRDFFKDVSIPSEPHKATWTAYHSYYPIGIGAAAGFSEIDGDDRRIQRSVQSGRNYQQHFQNPAFTDYEKAHLWHAPFDRIAAGRRTFTDTRRAKLKMGDPRNLQGFIQLNLFLDDGNGQAIEGDARDIVGATRDYHRYGKHRGELKFPLQPVTGYVQLKVPTRLIEARKDRRVFRFGSGSLFFLWRGEPANSWPNNKRRKILRFEPKPEIFSRQFQLPVANLGHLDDQENEQHVYFAPIPIIDPERLEVEFSRIRTFTVQAIYVTPQGSSVRSEQLRVQYNDTEIDRDFNSRKNEISGLLRDGMASLILDSTRYYLRQDMFKVNALKPHLDFLSSDAAEQIISDNPDLIWMAWLRHEVQLRLFYEDVFRSHYAGENPTMNRPELPEVLASSHIRTFIEKTEKALQTSIRADKGNKDLAGHALNMLGE